MTLLPTLTSRSTVAVNRLVAFDKDTVPEDRLERLQKYIDREKLMTKADKGVFFSGLEGTSKTAAALWLWVLAIDTYTKCFKLCAPPNPVRFRSSRFVP